jgi:hypothetical protein
VNFDAFMRFRSSPSQGFSAENSNQKRGRFRGSHQRAPRTSKTAMAEQLSCAEPLDWPPNTEVQSLILADISAL